MGLPEIIIDFKSKGTSAIQRSQKGVAFFLFTKTSGENALGEYNNINQIEAHIFSQSEKTAIDDCFFDGA